MTPGNYPVIDMHSHYMPAEVIARGGFADGRNIADSARKRLQPYQCIRDIECTLKVMYESGIDVTVLSIAQWSSLGLEASRIINNDYAEVIRKYPGKFVGCINIPLLADSAVIYELERAVKELGLKVVSLVTSTIGLSLGSKELTPLFDKISRLDIPVVVHPAIWTPLWGGLEYNLSYHVSREYEIAKTTVEVLYGWLGKYPNLKFIMPHFGGGMPSLKGRIAAWYEPANWEIPASIKDGGKTFEEIFDKLYFDMAGFAGWMPIAKSALMTIRTDRLCFGTDYPLDFHGSEDIRLYIENIKQLDIPEADKHNILGGNAMRLFGLDCGKN
jgi:predicted TIM-barrel fold metal-dependent hydrolase